MNMNFKRKLPIPMEIKEQFPISYKLEQLKEKRDVEIKSIFEGKDDRFILVRRSQSGTATDRLTVAHHHTLKQKAQDKMPF